MYKFFIGCGKRERLIDSAFIDISDRSYNFIEIGKFKEMLKMSIGVVDSFPLLLDFQHILYVICVCQWA